MRDAERVFYWCPKLHCPERVPQRHPGLSELTHRPGMNSLAEGTQTRLRVT
jgi:hypothetical protein